MIRSLRTAVSAVGICAAATVATGEELFFDNIFVIGDSLSDGGTYSQAVQAGGGGLLPPIRYRFLTNAADGSSLTYAEVLAAELGIDLQPNVLTGVVPAGIPQVDLGGTNFAEGGARVADQPGINFDPTAGITTLPLTQQVDRLLAATPVLDASDLIILWGGANDVFAQSAAVNAALIDPATAAGNMAAAAASLGQQVDRLRAAGAQTIIVVTVPDIGSTPFGLSSGPLGAALLTALGDAFNAQLTASVAGNAVIVDSQQLLGAIQADPARYGFTAANAATVPACLGSSLTCVQGLNASPDSEERVFADGVHPTTAAHALFGQAAMAGLRAGTQVGVISVATLTALRQQSLSLENRLNPTVLSYTDAQGNRMRRDVGHVDVFASLEFGAYDSDPQQIAPGLSGSTQVAKAGFDVVVAPNATIGAGLSFDRGQVDFDNNAGGFESRLLVGALFGQVALSEAVYLNAAVGGGAIDVTDFTRQFQLGPATEAYRAETDGRYRFARIGGGAFVPLNDSVLLNPFAHYTHETVAIDGFTETAGAASLSFGESEYSAQRLTAGLAALISPPSMPDWTIALRGSIEHDLNDDPLTVSLGPNPATLGRVSAPRPDRTWGYISATIVRDLGPGSFLSFSASTSIGQNGSSGIVGSIGYKTTF